MYALLVLLLALLVPPPAGAGEYSYAHRPKVTIKGAGTHVSPYPMGKRAAAIWRADACWRDCTSDCNWRMEACLGAADADACRPHLDACDRACLRACRNRGGPLLGFIDF